LREALAQSINVPAIKALYLVGIKDALKMASGLGITSLTNADQYGLTLVLGGGEVSLLEMVNAYGVFANEGRRVPYRNILRIEDSSGELLRSFSPPQDQVLDREIALQVSDVLSDNVARTPAFGSASYLHFPGRDVAVKTGTTNDYRDAWIIGYSPSFVLGSWVGNNDNTSMEKRVAGFIVAPMWNEMMNRVLASSTVETFREPKPATTASTKPIIRGVWQGGRVYEIDSVSGKLATPETPPEYRKKIYNMDIHSILHWVQKGDPLGPQPANPANDPQYTLWETPVRVWAEKMGYTENNTTPAPTDYDNVHTSDTAPQIVLTSPQDGSIHPRNAVIPITFTNTSSYTISRVDYHINGVFVGSSRKEPYLFSLTNDLLPETTEPITIRVTIQDVVGNTGSASATFSRTLE
jgi:membrane peptidoglycan carboxypeptidase